jgi:hypothetical protein
MNGSQDIAPGSRDTLVTPRQTWGLRMTMAL